MNIEDEIIQGHEDEIRSFKDGVTERDKFPYPNHADDPEPLQGVVPKERLRYTPKILERVHTSDVIGVWTDQVERSRVIWQDFITAFRPHNIRIRYRPMKCEWRDLFKQKYIYLDPESTRSTAEVIIDILYRDENISS